MLGSVASTANRIVNSSVTTLLGVECQIYLRLRILMTAEDYGDQCAIIGVFRSRSLVSKGRSSMLLDY